MCLKQKKSFIPYDEKLSLKEYKKYLNKKEYTWQTFQNHIFSSLSQMGKEQLDNFKHYLIAQKRETELKCNDSFLTFIGFFITILTFLATGMLTVLLATEEPTAIYKENTLYVEEHLKSSLPENTLKILSDNNIDIYTRQEDTNIIVLLPETHDKIEKDILLELYEYGIIASIGTLPKYIPKEEFAIFYIAFAAIALLVYSLGYYFVYKRSVNKNNIKNYFYSDIIELIDIHLQHSEQSLQSQKHISNRNVPIQINITINPKRIHRI
ncbi:MAG: hypothetical protein IJZ55_08880 [Lachnospiraceae bacterium]|nr:hypothetical protein [Lachnospiraceae bacterium]